MILDSEAEAYLRGHEFSSGYRFPIGRSRSVGRNDFVSAAARGKRVLHVGCADHIELIEEKRQRGTYLHDVLARSASHVVGTDTNEAALEEMRGIGIQDLYHPDNLPPALEFDLVVAADVIEHVGNVEDFLRSLAVHACDVLVTTPNAFGALNRLQFKREFINTDHRYWFSPYTLSKSLVEAGYTMVDLSYTDDFPLRQPIRSVLRRAFPLTRDGLAALASPRTKQGDPAAAQGPPASPPPDPTSSVHEE